MPLRVVIDDEVGEVLKRQAEPLVDSVNSVLRRILGLSKSPQSPMFFEIDVLGDRGLRVATSIVEGERARVASAARQTERSRQKRHHGRDDRARSRAPKGSLLDERAYWKPILQVLADSPEGSVQAREVVERVGEMLADRLTELDRARVSSGGLRWQGRVMFARLRMKDSGLLKPDSPRGVWEISDRGREALRSHDTDAA